MPIIEGIAAAKAALDVSKTLMDLVNRPDLNAADVRLRVSELLIHLVNAQVALGEAQVEISDLRQKFEDREAIKAIEADMEFRNDGGFWIRKSEAGKGLIPYCPACWGKDHKLVAMAPYSKPGIYRCALHEGTAYSTSEYQKWLERQPKQQPVVRSSWLDSDRY